jgi:thymidylate synthase
MNKLLIHKIEARDLPDLWFQAVHDVLDVGREFVIDRGSFQGHKRLEYDYFIGHVEFPGTRSLIPDIPSHLGIPNPVDNDFIFGGKGQDRSYVEYLMSPRKEPGELYTYGERLTNFCVPDSIPGSRYLNQIETIIKIYKESGHRTNQLVLQVATPSDLLLEHAPCLRHIDTRIQDGALHFFVYFRSWDLWSGTPANLAAIQVLKEYMADEIGVEDGQMIVESKGLHLYDYAVDFAKARCLKR